MNILGIETSCDETAAAVVQDGAKLLSHVVASQIDIHREFGGVVPEIAARSHIEAILPIVDKALEQAFPAKSASASELWDSIDGIAVTHGPGLSGSLLIGTLTARTLAITKQKALWPIHHVEAHTYANFITSSRGKLGLSLPSHDPEFPLLSLTVSGGHSQLILFTDHGQYRLLGRTRDDAVGEAFDKVAKVLGLSYPGGPSISRAAQDGNKDAYQFPISMLENPYDFSFSGLKTAVLRHLQGLIGEDYSYPSFEIAARLSTQQINDTAASFQETAVKTLVEKTLRAYYEHQPKSVVIAGGVAANQRLREVLQDRMPTQIEYAPISLCTDNAAMIASRGYWEALSTEATDPYLLEVKPSLPM